MVGSFRRLLGLLTAIGLLSIQLLSTPTRAAEDKPAVVDEATKPIARDEGCWVFSRMAKTGSSTLTLILEDWYKRNNYIFRAFSPHRWHHLPRGKNFRTENTTLVGGAYSEALFALGEGGECKWFTIFRHPIPRLVSAFYYCKYKRPDDTPCGGGAMDLATADFYSFAELWSNMALLHFITGFVTPNEVLAYPAVKALSPKISAYYKIRLYVNELYEKDMAAGGAAHFSGVHDEALYKFLDPAIRRLETKFAAVGILDDFDRTLQLFNKALIMPNLDWVDYFNNLGAQNAGEKRVQDESEETLRLAWQDPTIHKFLWLDMLFYDRALALFNDQLVAYGLA